MKDKKALHLLFCENYFVVTFEKKKLLSEAV